MVLSLGGSKLSELDEKYHHLARAVLFKGLHDCQPQDDTSVTVEKSEILKAFDYAGRILRSNEGDDHYRQMAETVFVTCIRLCRCLYFPEEARTIVLQGKKYQITTEQQLAVLRRNFADLDQYES